MYASVRLSFQKRKRRRKSLLGLELVSKHSKFVSSSQWLVIKCQIATRSSKKKGVYDSHDVDGRVGKSIRGHCSTDIINGENQVVSKSSDVTTADAFDKRQQQQDSTSSTSSLATTISADGNFDL
ncbi:hypothetical protein Tco_1152701 [Tanacetum coccineum]